MLDNLMGILMSIKATDVIDIVIVAYLLYTLLGFIKETRAQQLFRGVLLIIGFFLAISKGTGYSRKKRSREEAGPWRDILSLMWKPPTRKTAG